MRHREKKAHSNLYKHNSLILNPTSLSEISTTIHPETNVKSQKLAL